MEKLNEFSDAAIEMIKAYSVTILSAIIVLLVGLWVINLIGKSVKKVMKKRDVDPSLRSFLSSLISIGLKTLLIVSVISMLGVEATSFIAILGAAGLAIGMALSGTLQNFAGGVLLLMFRPFKVGDYIIAQGYEGVVESMQVFVTTLNTIDNKTVFIPNGPLSNDSLVNVTRNPLRRVDLKFGIGYSDNIDEARRIMLEVGEQSEKILKDPAPEVIVSELGDSSVNFYARYWCKTEDYWSVYFSTIEDVKKSFDKGGISIPFPQRDIHLFNANG